MNISRILKRAIYGVYKTAKRLLWVNSNSGANEGFVCVACHSTYDHQHYQCPTCGEMVLLSLDEDEGDRPEEEPG